MPAHKGRPPTAVEVALCICFNANGRALMAIAPGRSKKLHDKRESRQLGG